MLLDNKAPVKVFKEISEYANIFFAKVAAKLVEYIEINNYSTNVNNDKKSPYRSIYSQGPMELKMLKTYIKINFKNILI